MIEIKYRSARALARRSGFLLHRLRCDRSQYQTASTAIVNHANNP
jgi:hypothetical protein